jgi:hypothetical protein
VIFRDQLGETSGLMRRRPIARNKRQNKKFGVHQIPRVFDLDGSSLYSNLPCFVALIKARWSSHTPLLRALQRASSALLQRPKSTREQSWNPGRSLCTFAPPLCLRLVPYTCRLRTHSPSGRPGNDLHLYLNTTIQEPNTIPAGQSPTGTAVFPPSSANCSAQWLNSNDVPWDMSLPCSSSSQFSTWTMTMKKPQGGNVGSLATEKFALVFKLVDSVIIIGKNNTKVFEGGHQFEVGVNMNGQ